MNAQQQLERGNKAKRLLEDELLQEAFSTIKTNLHTKFEESKVDQVDAREKIYLMLHMVKEVKRHLEQVLRTGVMAEKILEDEKKKRRFFK